MIAQVAATLVGLWLMFAPWVFGYGDPASANDRIVGPLAACFATIAWWEATRGARWVNLPLGVWLLFAPWVLGYDDPVAIGNDMLAGVVLGNLALVRGRVSNRYGGGWASLLPDRPVAHPGDVTIRDDELPAD